MSNKMPRVAAKEVIVAIEKIGFVFSRQTGSHKIYKNLLTGKRVTIPFHGGKILHPKVLASIIRDAEFTAEKFKTLL